MDFNIGTAEGMARTCARARYLTADLVLRDLVIGRFQRAKSRSHQITKVAKFSRGVAGFGRLLMLYRSIAVGMRNLATAKA
jgi:hypothetical protein